MLLIFRAYFIIGLLCLSINSIAQQDFKKDQINKNLKILLISDLNDAYGDTTYSKEVHDVISKIGSLKPDIILCAGDMVAGQKRSLTSNQIKSMWKGFDQVVMQPITRLGIPFGFTVGNHDASPTFLIDREESALYWDKNKGNTNLNFVDDKNYPYYFSYIKNNVFMLSWDASSSTITPEVKAWMTEQLNSEIAKKSRYRILIGHLPLYALVKSKNKPGEVLDDANAIENFIKKLNVDLYISGHQHVYYPAQSNTLTLLHTGVLGGGPRQLLGDTQPERKAYAWLEIPKRKPNARILIRGIDPTINKLIPHQSLPKKVEGFNGVVFLKD